MYKKSLRRWVSFVTLFTMIFSLLIPMIFFAGSIAEASTIDYSKVPKLLITELVPDSSNIKNAAGASVDGYEFIEVYNNTNKTVNFKDYNVAYRYPDKGPSGDVIWSAGSGDILIPSQTPVVFWVMNADNQNLSASDFNNNYHTGLQENINLFRIDGGGGMSNAGPRDLVIKDKNGTEISIASYQNDAQTQADKGIFYQYPVDGSTNMVMYSAGLAAATPGAVDSVQVPAVPVNLSGPPVIIHTPLTNADANNDLDMTAQITNVEQNETVIAAVYYKTALQSVFQSVYMHVTGGSNYQAFIPKATLTENQLQYYIQANVGIQQVKTDIYSVEVALPAFDYQKVPPLLVTEVVPDSTNVGTADGYEFIEIYNNTDQSIDFKDYKIVYRYTDSGPNADVVWPADKEDTVIPSRSTLVFWIINSQNTNSTVADFNANYKTNLIQGKDIVRIYCDGMANSANRGILIATNTGTVLSETYYVAGDAKPNKGILYKYPGDGSTKMIKYSAAVENATPGTAASIQVPYQVVNVIADAVNPAFTDLTNKKEIDQTDNLELIGEAKDDNAVKTVALYYKTDKQSAYLKRFLKQSFADTLYHYTVYSPELIGGSYVDYYFVVSDGTNEMTTGTNRVTIVGGSDRSNLRLNLKDGDFIAKTKMIKGTGEGLSPDDLHLAIDGKELTQSTFHAAEKDAYFAFDVTGIDYYFKNGVTIGQEILYTFQDPIQSYTTLSIPIQADRLKEGDNVISIRAGSKASPFDDRPEENKDDFDVKNVRLVLSDGTEIYDANYADPAKVIKMGDSTGKYPAVDFHFAVPADKLASKAYVWDTKLISDGAHQISLSNNGYETITSNVTVDNTAPAIQPIVEEGKTYRGAFTIDAAVTDALAGVDKVETTFDGQPITIPYATSSANLQGGSHVFSVTAADKVGNVSTVSVNFQVPDENPYKPELIAPELGANGVDRNARLTVKAADPTNDNMNVSFYRGFKYDASTAGQFTGYRNASDTEPPKQEKPEGETLFSLEDYQKISAPDGNYLVDDSVEKFPYQRFEIQLDDSVKNTDEVEIDWKGKSLEGRKVSLYAWSPVETKWNILDTKIADNDDFELQARVLAGDFANNHKIQVIVQDEIASTSANYDFSFVWMSDTQYYAESYPYIYRDTVKWIADHKEDNKIKYVVHTGDIVDNADQNYQWVEADKDMKVLEDAHIPYGVLAGNHDVEHQNNNYNYYWQWFGEDRFKNQPTYGGSYDNNRGHYDLVSSNGNDFIVVYMGWGYGDKEIDWINEVLKKYPNRKAILCFHEFLLVSNNRAPMADVIFERVVKPNKNVFAVLCGHYHDAELHVDALDDNGDGIPDRNVYQVLADYQGAPEGGLGYIRLMQFDMAHNKINIKTFSPYLNHFNYYDPAQYPNKDEFSVSLDLQPVTKRIATDYIGMKVYTDQLIGKVDHAASGQQASVTWSNLAENAKYEWYASAEDEFSGKQLSDIWGFHTGTVITNPVTETSSGDTTSSGSNTAPAGDTSKNSPADAQPVGGVIQTQRQEDGTFSVSNETIKQAISNTSSGTVEIHMDLQSNNAEPIQLQLDGEGIKAAQEQKTVFKMITSDMTIELPSTALPANASEAEAVKLYVNTSFSTAAQNAIINATGQNIAYTSTKLVFALQLTTVKGGTETSVHQFSEPATIVKTLTSEQLQGIDTDYAGVYYLNGERAEYIGGVFKGNQVSFKLNHFSEYAILEYRKDFTDMQGHWGGTYTQKLAAKHIIEGVDQDHFAPDIAVKRADIAVLAVKALGFDKPDYKDSFKDIAKDKYYAPYVGKASELGLIQGDQGKYRPEDNITREEAAIFLMRFYEYKNNKHITAKPDQDFADIDAAAEWSRSSIRSAQAAGLVGGKGGNLFDPKAILTRAEFAKMMLEAINLQ